MLCCLLETLFTVLTSQFVLGFAAGVYFWLCWTHPRTRTVRPGHQPTVSLPHSETLELHHNTLSSCSQKVRVCLAETGLKHRQIHHVLPSSGSWETKSAAFLTNVNPAGTVPVLVHDGHPVYESHEQIVYIDQVLMPGGPRLTPTDPEKKKVMEKWVNQGAMIMSDVDKKNPWKGLESRAGNLLGAITMPLFAAHVYANFSVLMVVQSISMLPLVKDKAFIFMHVLFKILGAKAFQKMSLLDNMASVARKAIYHHFEQITKELEGGSGPYLCGDQYTLADVSMVPIFERMELACWWTDAVKRDSPLVLKYWNTIQQRDGYKASKMDDDYKAQLKKASNQINAWRKEFPWFNAYYEGTA